jgi:hypothetical protein
MPTVQPGCVFEIAFVVAAARKSVAELLASDYY